VDPRATSALKHMDFFLDPQVWFQSHLKISQEFPDVNLRPRLGGWNTAWPPSRSFLV